MIPRTTLRNALADPQLLGGTLDGPSWDPWRALLLAAMGEELDVQERETFTNFTGGREREPGQRVEEFVAVKGRRSGGSYSIGVLATYISGLCQHPALRRGERGVCLIIAPDQRQADVVLDYITANFEASPILKQLVESRTARELRLNNGITIEVRASDFRRLRGLTYVAVICDEVAFWLSDEYSSNPDDEILNSVRPGLGTTDGLLVMISSPYARRGELWKTYQRHYGPQGDKEILVAQGATKHFNITLPQRVIDRAYQRDAIAASAEYGAEFRRDIEAIFSIEAINACVTPKCYERGPERGLAYMGFTDPSGGSADSFGLAIGHYDYAANKVIVDCIRETVPPFSPERVCEEYATTLKSYNVFTVIGDRYAKLWPVEQLARFGIKYEQSAAPKSDLYLALLPLINSRRIDLLDHPKLINQLVGLERSISRGGNESIGHMPGFHDDVCNCVAGLSSLANKYGGFDASWNWVNGPEPKNEDKKIAEARRNAEWRQHQYFRHLLGGNAASILAPRTFVWK